MNKTRRSANLVSKNNIFSSITNHRVGIGTTIPQYQLDVLGDINFSGSLNQGGSSFVASRWTAGTGDDIYRLSGDVGIGTTNPQYSLDVLGDINFTGTFRQNGSAFVASRWTAGTGDDIYRLNGDVGIGISNPQYSLDVLGDINFTGTFRQNGSEFVASSVATNSVGLGTHTYGDYVKDIIGTANQITVTSGTGEGSSPTLSIPNQFTAPQDVRITRDLQVDRDLNVNGNITIGGTSATLFTTELKVYDADIVLGIRTDESGNDISTDNTANHGGIAVASTEGTPLISLYDVGIGETNPATYKKIMWFKSGTFAGLGTDAWLINYGVGIGSTQVPDGVRLAAGSVQFTESDLSVVRNINATGIVTATSFSGDGSSITGIARGGGSDEIFYENGQTVTTDYTISTSKNAMSAGPIGIATGITVTIPSGSTWTIV
jgi:hypothetical protein